MAAKSPLTDIGGESHAAGHWGPELKFAGYDGIIVKGQSKKPTYLWIDDVHVKIRTQNIYGAKLAMKLMTR